MKKKVDRRLLLCKPPELWTSRPPVPRESWRRMQQFAREVEPTSQLPTACATSSITRDLERVRQKLLISDISVERTAVLDAVAHTLSGYKGRKLAAVVRQMTNTSVGHEDRGERAVLSYNLELLLHNALLSRIPGPYEGPVDRLGMLRETLLSLDSLSCEVHNSLSVHYGVRGMWLCGGGTEALAFLQEGIEAQARVMRQAEGRIKTRDLVLPQVLRDGSLDRWYLDLHGLGPSCAAVMCIWWLKELRTLASHGTMPPAVGIVTGWGRHSRGFSIVQAAVQVGALTNPTLGI
ncbi:hypothetical protein CYMTET_24526 [Cymbomonas tetramitiformis]|uniref:Smr domain-containing protein n=1 Tax=Cymbomonas tetramitiformis TaxID=36881 RepID=A0AAE0KZU2_9CHLO|nr:hypothetical protein CYMTET_24526 [Cymbomonas tetramitiformis]